MNFGYKAIKKITNTCGIGILGFSKDRSEVVYEFYGIDESGKVQPVTLPSSVKIDVDREAHDATFIVAGSTQSLKEFRKCGGTV